MEGTQSKTKSSSKSPNCGPDMDWMNVPKSTPKSLQSQRITKAAELSTTQATAGLMVPLQLWEPVVTQKYLTCQTKRNSTEKSSILPSLTARMPKGRELSSSAVELVQLRRCGGPLISKPTISVLARSQKWCVFTRWNFSYSRDSTSTPIGLLSYFSRSG
jgi:hypothetical protein